jgi:hypothetical protein
VLAAIGYCCLGCERACEATCSLCSRACCHGCCPRDRPSPVFLNYTLVANVPIAAIAIIVAIISFINGATDKHGCDMFIHPGAWLLIQAALAIFFIAFAVRIYILLGKKGHRDIESHGQDAYAPAPVF